MRSSAIGSGAPPPVDLQLERKTGDFVRGLIEAGELTVVHDLSDGGLAHGLVESVLRNHVGVEVRLGDDPFVDLFSESTARAVVTTTDDRVEALLQRLGFWHFDQIAAWTPAELAWVDANLDAFNGRATREDWVGQAKLLASGGETEHSRAVTRGEIET